MAEVVNGECVCGFTVERLMSGALRSGNSRQITACYNCGTLKSRYCSPDENTKICPECQEETTDIIYQDNNKYLCPKCRKPDLLLRTTMMAD